MGIGEAVEAMENGQKVRRAGWNGKGMWLCLMPSLFLPKESVNVRTKSHIGEADLDCQPYIVMWTAQGKWQPGWLASQPDLLAKDWEVVK